MGTFLWIVGIGFVGLIVFIGCNSKKWSEESHKGLTEHYAKEGKRYICSFYDTMNKIKYITGFKDLSACDVTDITLTNEDIEINFKDAKTRFIKAEDVKDIYINSEYELKEKVSAGKIMVFGLMGLGMTSKKEEIKKYMIIECNYDNYNTALIFLIEHPGQIVQKMREVYI